MVLTFHALKVGQRFRFTHVKPVSPYTDRPITGVLVKTSVHQYVRLGYPDDGFRVGSTKSHVARAR